MKFEVTKTMIKLVASDLDGTIIGKNNTICLNNLKAMEDISRISVNFAICTGKTYPLIKKDCRKFNATYGIFGNGNQIINLKTGEEIYRSSLSLKDVEKCIAIARNYQLHIHLYTETSIITEKLMYMDLRNYKIKEMTQNEELQIETVSSIENYLEEKQPTIFKLVISSSSDLSFLISSILEVAPVSICRIPKYAQYKDTIIDKEYEYLDITPKHSNKQEALKFLGNYLHIASEEIMAIGDNMNDKEMIENSGVGIAVANAYEQIKQVASYTTQNAVDDGGFAEAVYKFIEF